MDLQLMLLLLFAFLIRLALIGYGMWQDSTMAVKYTDVDYYVFNDAAAFMYKGESPYNRATYRYTPLFAWILQPNIIWNEIFGKLLFTVFDVLTGYLVYSITTTKGASPKKSQLYACLWLFNPLSMTVSTRGNAESIMTFLVLLSLKFMADKTYFLAGLIYGLAVHVKIYPVTYALPIYLLLGNTSSGQGARGWSWKREILKLLPNKDRCVFILASLSTAVGLTMLYYYWYDWEFLYNTYLYHVTRRDTRHNFSPYFYLLYQLSMGDNSIIIGLVTFLPQLVLLVALSVKFHTDPPAVFFLNTFAFVAFNKVCTSQYFLWYLGLFPLLVPNLHISMTTAIVAVVVWFAGQGIWLLPAYYLEFEGQNTFLHIWMAGLLFFCANIYIMYVVISNYKISPWNLNSVQTKSEKKTKKEPQQQQQKQQQQQQKHQQKTELSKKKPRKRFYKSS